MIWAKSRLGIRMHIRDQAGSFWREHRDRLD